MKHRKIVLLGLMVLMPAALGIAQDGSSKPKKESKLPSDKSKSDSEDQSVKAAAENPNYSIGPEDELYVSVWKEPDVSRTVSVRPDGKISLPLINDVQAAGLTPMKLAADIAQKLTKFISDPQVTVIITKINSQHVFIVGEVPRAGTYPLLPNMTVLQALSSAGGFTQFANTKKIHVLRMEDGRQVSLTFNYKDVVSGRHSDQNIVLKAGDTIVVP